MTEGNASEMRPTAFVGVNIVPLDAAKTLCDWTVIVRNGRIDEMRPREDLTVPEGAVSIDGAGKYLLPGFADMHVHIGFPALLKSNDEAAYDKLARETADDMALYLANGVTTVRNMSGAPFHLDLAARIAKGDLPGPDVRSTSAILDGTPPVWDFSPRIDTPEAARKKVREIKTDGYEAIKVYNHLSAEVYTALVQEGHKVGLPVVGHVPFSVGIHGALNAGQHCIEHFRGYDFDPSRAPGQSGVPERFSTWLTLTDVQLDAYAEETERAGTWNCPTLVVVDSGLSAAEHGVGGMSDSMRYVASGLRAMMEDGVRNPVFSKDILRVLGDGKPRQLALLKRLHDRNNRLVVGTDCSIFSIVPGFSIHDELANFVAAGLTPREALICCCVNPAQYYGETGWGTVAPGKRADLVLLDDDPLADIANTRKVFGTMARGHWYGRDTLDAALRANLERYPPDPRAAAT